MHSNHLTIVRSITPQPQPISITEKVADHYSILQGYWDTFVTRNFTQSFLLKEKRFIEGWFENYLTKDEDFPDQERPLLVWEAMVPVHGRQRIVEFSKGL